MSLQLQLYGFYNRLARKIAIANLGGPVKRKKYMKARKMFYVTVILISIIVLLLLLLLQLRKTKKKLTESLKAYNFIQYEIT